MQTVSGLYSTLNSASGMFPAINKSVSMNNRNIKYSAPVFKFNDAHVVSTFQAPLDARNMEIIQIEAVKPKPKQEQGGAADAWGVHAKALAAVEAQQQQAFKAHIEAQQQAQALKAQQQAQARKAQQQAQAQAQALKAQQAQAQAFKTQAQAYKRQLQALHVEQEAYYHSLYDEVRQADHHEQQRQNEQNAQTYNKYMEARKKVEQEPEQPTKKPLHLNKKNK